MSRAGDAGRVCTVGTLCGPQLERSRNCTTAVPGGERGKRGEEEANLAVYRLVAEEGLVELLCSHARAILADLIFPETGLAATLHRRYW